MNEDLVHLYDEAKKLKIVLVWQGLTYNYLLLIVQAFQNSIPISIYWLSYFLSGQIFKLLREIRLIITDEIGAGIITDTIIFTAKCVYTTFAQTTNIAGSIKSDEKLSNYWTSWSWLLLYLNKDIFKYCGYLKLYWYPTNIENNANLTMTFIQA